MPADILGYVTESHDRESVLDIPFIQMNAGAVWLAVASFIGGEYGGIKDATVNARKRSDYSLPRRFAIRIPDSPPRR